MTRYLVVKKKKISVDAIIFKSISRVFAMLMEKEEAKKLMLMARGNQNNSRELIETFLMLSKEQWILLESQEERELTSNCLMTLRLLTNDVPLAEIVLEDYPEIILDSKDLILGNKTDQQSMKQARGFLYNIQQVQQLPKDLAKLIKGFDPAQHFDDRNQTILNPS